MLREVGRISLGSGTFAWFAVFFMLWTSTLIFDSIEFSLKRVFKLDNARPYWVSKVMSLLFVPVAGLVFILLQTFNLFVDAFMRLSNYFDIAIIPLFLNSSTNPLTLSVVGRGGGGPTPLANQLCW